MSGWVKLHRQLLYSSVFKNERILKVWIWCLLRTNYQATETLVGLQSVSVKPGQFVCGSLSASRELGIPASTFSRYLKKLESLGNLVLEPRNKFTLVTVANWEKYQDLENEMANKWETDEKQMGTDKKLKNIKKEDTDSVHDRKEVRNYNKVIEELFVQFWAAYPRKEAKKAARKAFCRIVPLEVSKKRREARLNNLFQHLAVYVAEKKGTEKQFIKLPATWLNGEDFDVPPAGGEMSDSTH